MSISTFTFPRVRPCNEKPINKGEGEALRHTADDLLAKVGSGDNAACNLSQLRNLLCEAKGRPTSISYQYILLDYAEARIKVGEQKDAAIMLANEASELPVYWIEPSLLEKMTLIVFRYGDKEAKRRMKEIYRSASDFSFFWISLKLRVGKPITKSDLSKLESDLGFYKVLFLPLHLSSGRMDKSSNITSNKIKELAKRKREAFLVGLYEDALSSRYGSYWIGYFLREGYKTLFVFLILLLLAGAVIRWVKASRTKAGNGLGSQNLGSQNLRSGHEL